MAKTINIKYTAPKPAEEGSIRINATAVDVTFAKKQVPTASISISVDGLPKDKTTTLTLTNDNGILKKLILRVTLLFLLIFQKIVVFGISQ